MFGDDPVRARVVIGVTAASSGAAGCGAPNDDAAPTISIDVPTSTIAPGSTEQFTVTVDEPVTWALEQSTVPTTDPEYPLKVSADGRYLVDQRDTPWRVQADSAWLDLESRDARRSRPVPDRATCPGLQLVLPDGHGASVRSAHLRAEGPAQLRGQPAIRRAGGFLDGRVHTGVGGVLGVHRLGDRPSCGAGHGRHVRLHLPRMAGRRAGLVRGHAVAQPSLDAVFDWGVWLGNRYKDDAEHHLVRAR